MPNQKLVFADDIFVFETALRVRHTEVDAGQYLTIDALTALISEVRSRFFYAKGIQEISADYQGLIVDDLSLTMYSRVRVREELLFEVGIFDLSHEGGSLAIKVSRMFDGSVIANATLHFVNFDYRLNHTIAINATTKAALDPALG